MGASVSVDIFARDRASATFSRVGAAADDSGDKFRKLGTLAKAGGLAVAAGIGLAGGAVVALGKKAIDVEKEFSLSMSQIGAATGAPASEMQKLNDLAIKMGAETSFSANGAAQAMLELAKSGMTPATIQAGALAGTLTLAAAGGVDLEYAATTAANALATFNLKGKDMASVAAALAGGANASSASVKSLADGLSQVGPGATNAGMSLQDTVGVLAAFDAAGVKGSDAGTSLKTMLTRLIPASEAAEDAFEALGLQTESGNNAFIDAHGNFESITSIAGSLQKALGGLSEAERTKAMATIFGSDATRAATILMKQGSEGLAKYIRATKDQGAAEKMAKANTSGTAGALERLSGSVETAELLIGQKMAPTVINLANGLGDRLVPATEAVIDVASGLVDAFDSGGMDGLISKVEDLTGAQGKLSPIFDEVAGSAEALWDIAKELGPSFFDAVNGAEGLLSPLKLLDDVLGTVADVLDVVPDGVKEIGIQAGIAALLLPKFTGAVSATTGAVGTNIARLRQWRAEMSYTETRAGAVGTAVGKIGGAARGAAGIGGMLLLSQASQTTNKKMGILLGTLGGAAMGFAAGGPLGALIGGAAGAAMGIFADKTDEAGDAAARSKQDFNDLAASLDTLTGATSANTRETILNHLGRDDVLKLLNAEGVSSRTVVDSILGEADARRQVGEVLKGLQTEYRGLNREIVKAHQGARTSEEHDAAARSVQDQVKRSNAIWDVIHALKEETGITRKSIREGRAKARVLQDFSDLAHKVPKKVVTALDLKGVQPTVAGLARVANRYKGLDNKQLKAIIQAVGIDATVKQVRRVADEIKTTNKAKYDGEQFKRTLHSFMGGFAQDAETGGRKVADKLKGGTKGAKPDLDDYKRALSAGVNSGQITARQGAFGIGAALKSGLPPGFAGAGVQWSGAVAAAVHAAIAAGRRAADAHSPSRKTGLLGKDMAMGLVVGMKGQAGNLGNAGADLIRDLVKGISKGQVSAEKVLGAIDRRVEQTVDRVKGLLSKRGETVSAFQGFATSVFAATPGEGQAMTVDSLLAAQSAERDQAGDVKGAVRRLLGMGMSKSLIAQMQAAGPSGIQQLLTLSNASAAQISLLNNLNKQTQSDYASTGMNVFGATGGAAELAKARADEALAKSIAKELDSLIGNHMANYTFVLHGDTLVATLNRHDRDRGKHDRDKGKAKK